MSTQPNINASRIDGALSLSGSVFASSISATTFYSGSTNLSSLLGGGSSSVNIPRDRIAYGNALSAVTGTSAFTFVVSSSTLNIGSTVGKVAAPNTLQMYVGSTGIIVNDSGNMDFTQHVRGTGNAYFAGALRLGASAFASAPYSLHVDGHARFSGVTASTISATTFYSGTTELSTLFGSSNTVSGGTNISVTTVGSTATVNGTTVHTRATNLNLNYSYTDYLFNGGAGVTWTLQALKTDHKYTITNIGSNTLTVNSNAGANDIYDTSGAGAVNTISINANEGYLFIGNGTYWVARKIGM